MIEQLKNKIETLESENLKLRNELENSVNLKYRVGQTVYWKIEGNIRRGFIKAIHIDCYEDNKNRIIYDLCLFENSRIYERDQQYVFETKEQMLTHNEELNIEAQA